MQTYLMFSGFINIIPERKRNSDKNYSISIVVGITETELNAAIKDSELAMPGYQVLQCDRKEARF